VLVVVLLVAGLVCLCIGLLLSSTAWLIGSLAASVVAGVLIYRNRSLFAIPRPTPTTRRPPGKHSVAAEPAEPVRASAVATPPRPDPEVWVVDGRPRYHREGCQILDNQDAEVVPLSQADEDGFIPCSLCEPERIDLSSTA
jgi:hypothetical protein